MTKSLADRIKGASGLMLVDGLEVRGLNDEEQNQIVEALRRVPGSVAEVPGGNIGTPVFGHSDGRFYGEAQPPALQPGDGAREALEKIRRIPSKPFPDPSAHSWEAWGRAVYRAWQEIQHIAAIAALQRPDAAGDGAMKSAPASPTGDTQSGESLPASAAMGPSAGAEPFEPVQPHVYSPDYQAMGDCRVCGHGPNESHHLRPSQRPVWKIDHDGFVGVEIGSYKTLEGKEGVVLQQEGTRVVHVYGRKFLKPA